MGDSDNPHILPGPDIPEAESAVSTSQPTAPATSTTATTISSDASIQTGLLSPTIAVASADDPPSEGSDPVKSVSTTLATTQRIEPGLHSPLRHHRRTPSAPREIKETLDACTQYTNDEDDGRVHHRINQYIIKEEIGRGSYGAVHLATTSSGTEYAIKEFSKVRLRKRAQSNALRLGPRRAARGGLNPPASPYASDFDAGPASVTSAALEKDALYLIREEIAIMKKLNHPNVVQLIEVLDDPEEDSLYIVLEMCKKGVVMKIGLGQQVTPFSEEDCRCWFRDLILGIEYLHAQGIVHRDIKPDNLLVSEDDVLKVVDFGVSEMFTKPERMMITKSAGSPAFLAPELCIARLGDVSGTAADIWSMGVTLYCLRYGRLPFEGANILDMYEVIRTKPPALPEDENPDFVDLMGKILEKDPNNRITMPELREHPWVTKRGADTLLSTEENCADLIEPPNDLELHRAFTRKMNHLLCVMKVAHKFKVRLARKAAERAAALAESTPLPSEDPPTLNESPPSTVPMDKKAEASEIEALLRERRNNQRSIDNLFNDDPTSPLSDPILASPQARSPPLFLGIGTGEHPISDDENIPYAVSDSPTGVDFNIYDRAYEAEVERIMANPARRSSSMYLNRFVNDREQYKSVSNMMDTTVRPGQRPRPRPRVPGPEVEKEG